MSDRNSIVAIYPKSLNGKEHIMLIKTTTLKGYTLNSVI